MIQRNPNYPEPAPTVGRPPSLRLWVPLILAAALLLALLMFLVLPRLWDILFPVELEHRTVTLGLLKALDVALGDFTRRNPETPVESFLVPDQVNAGVKALHRCLRDGRYLDMEMMQRSDRIAIDRDGEAMFVDAWRNPVVFIPASAAGRSFTCRNAAGQAYTVHAPPDFAGRPWLMWSVGPDGVNQSRGGDDLVPSRDRTPTNP